MMKRDVVLPHGDVDPAQILTAFGDRKLYFFRIGPAFKAREGLVQVSQGGGIVFKQEMAITAQHDHAVY